MDKEFLDVYQSLKKDKQGSLVDARFGYQKYWALREAYRLFESGEDFYVVFEGLEDIDILKNNEIHAYQVKTKDNRVTYTYTMMSKKDKNTGKSILSKLSEKENLPCISTLNLVTNLHFENTYNKSGVTYNPSHIPFIELNDEFNNKVKNHIYDIRKETPDLRKYNYIYSDLPLNNTREAMIGFTSDFLRNNSSVERVALFFDFIDSETERRIRKINPDNFEEKAISKSYLQNILDNYDQTHNYLMNLCQTIIKKYDVLTRRKLNLCLIDMNKHSFNSVCIRNVNSKVISYLETNKELVTSLDDKELCDYLYANLDIGDAVLHDDKLAYIIVGVANYILGGKCNE